MAKVRPFKQANIRLVLFATIGFYLACAFNNCSPVNFAKDISVEKVQFSSSGSVLIDGGAPYSNNSERKVQLSLVNKDADEMYITQDPQCLVGGQWEPKVDSKEWVLPEANARGRVYVKYRSKSLENSESACVNDDILHDDKAPLIDISPGAPKLIGLAHKGKAVQIAFTAHDQIPTNMAAEASGLDLASVACSKQGTADQLCKDQSFVIPVTINSEGLETFKVAARDLAGNAAETLHSVESDFTPPTVTINAGPEGLVNISVAPFSYSGSDTRPGPLTYQCVFAKAASYSTSNLTNCESSYPTPDAGSYKFGVIAIDEAGNKSTIAERSFTIDKTAPTIIITKHPAAFTNDTSETLEYTSADPAKPLATAECKLDGAARACSTSSVTLTSLSEGVHKFEVRGTDQLSNVTNWASATWTTDFTKPTGRITSAPTARTRVKTATFVYQFTDNLSGVDSSTIKCSFQKPADPTPQLAACSSTTQTYALGADGVYTFRAQAADRAGNNSDVISYTFTLDTTAPVLTVNGPTGYTNNPNVKLDIIATDNSGQPAEKKCAIDKTAPATADYVTCPADGVFPLTPGQHTITVIAVDDVGNTSPPNTRTLIIDNKAPVLTWGAIPADSSDSRVPVTITFTVIDESPITSVVCTYRDVATGETKTVASCFTPSANSTSGNGVIKIQAPGVGEQLVRVVATDAAGNKTDESKTWTTAKWFEVGSGNNQATVVFEDDTFTGDDDYNEGVIDFNIVEAYNGKNELTKVTIDFTPIANGIGTWNENGRTHYIASKLMMAIDGKFRPNSVTGKNNVNSKPLVEGMTSSDRVTVTKLKLDGTVISSQDVPFNNNVQIFDFQDVFANPDGTLNFKVNTYQDRPETWRKPNYKLRLEVNVKNPALNKAESRLKNNSKDVDLGRYRLVLDIWPTNGTKHTDIDLIDVVPTAFDNNIKPWGFFVPQNWKYPIENEYGNLKIQASYPKFDDYLKCLRDRANNSEASCTETAKNWFLYPGNTNYIFPREKLP